jgi:hypothetical protein
MTMIGVAAFVLSIIAGVMSKSTFSPRMTSIKQTACSHRAITALALLTFLLPGVASAHGNVAMEDDRCVQRVGGNLVHFNAYQPLYEAKAQYCTEIPGEGETFLVVDLVDPRLRTMPVGVRVVRGIDGAAEDETVAYWPPATHPDGVVRGEAKLVKGLYQLIITPEGFSPTSYLLRVQQVDYATIARKTMGPITIILLFLLMGYEFSKSKRFRSWRISGHA